MVTTLTRPESVTELGPVGNSGAWAVETTLPYRAEVTIQGVAPLLFHRWQSESVKAKAESAKNSKAKKSDDTESYLYRCPNGNIGLPGLYLTAALSSPGGAAKYKQDPRSPRKSALDLYRAAVLPLTECADLGVAAPDYLDARRAVVQRNGITRTRPAFHPGWRATVELLVTMPEYVSPADLLETITLAGRVIGLGDFRPSHGRFQVVAFEVLTD